MKSIPAFVAVWLSASLFAAETPSSLHPEIPYGNNPPAGAYASVNGIKLYYEVYGEGHPLLQIHGNGQDIASLENQIKFFAARYKTIVADSRGHGKSDLGVGRLTYEQMAEDLNALLDRLGQKSVYVLGWSDGGILGLLLAIHHPDKVEKLAVMGANLEPSGAYDWALRWVTNQEQVAKRMIAQEDKSRDWKLFQQQLDLLWNQPHIQLADLRKITAPTLVMAGDKDVIRGEHTLQIFENIPNAHLCVFPGATHLLPSEDPVLFNQTVERFFSKPFDRPDTKNLFQ